MITRSGDSVVYMPTVTTTEALLGHQEGLLLRNRWLHWLPLLLLMHSRETSVFRDEDLACFYGRLPWRVMSQVPDLCWERPLDTTLRLVLLVGMIPHCRKRNGVKTCADSVTSIDTAQRQRRRLLLGTILRYWKVRLLSYYWFVRITMIVPIHPKSVTSSPYDLGSGYW